MTSAEFLVLRLEGPLMSFGGVQVDENNTTEAFPGLSLLTGLLGNALGYEHYDFEKLQRLQERIRYAARQDRRGREIMDYQTVDLGQDFLREGWTTRGAPGRRAGGSAKTGTHIRRRYYWADAVYTVVLTLDPAEEEPDLDMCARALAEPCRPLYLGRRACPPAGPVMMEKRNAVGLRQALAETPLSNRASEQASYTAWWPHDPSKEAPGLGRVIPINDRRDWANRVHTGRRFVWEGQLLREEISHAG